MTNSFFNFTEAPDFASAIAETYTSVNESYDRREKLERENDETRLKNAAMPLKMIEALAEFAPKAKKLADEIREDRYTKDIQKKSVFETPAQIERAKKAESALKEAQKVDNYLTGEAIKYQDISTLKMLAGNDINQLTLKNQFIEKQRLGLYKAWSTHLAEKFPGGIEDQRQYNEEFRKFQEAFNKPLIQMGYDSKFLTLRLGKTYDEILATGLTDTRDAEFAALNRDIVSKNVEALGNVVKNENPEASFYEWLDIHKGLHGGNQGQTARYGLQLLVRGVELDQISASTVESILNSIVDAKGDKAKLLIEKLGGNVQADAFIDSVVESLEQAKKKEVTAITEKNSTYRTSYELELNKALYSGDTLPSKEDLANYIYKDPETRFDFSKGNLPESVRKKLSAEAGDDAKHLPLVYKKAALGILERKDVTKINDPFIRSQFLSQLSGQGSGGTGGSGGISSLATSTAKTIANTYTKETDGDKAKTIKWDNVNDQVKLHYPSVYAKHYAIAKAEPATETTLGRSREMVAHGETQKELLLRAKNGEFDTWGEGTTRELELLSAVEHIKTGENTDQFLDTEIIVGSEEALAEARKYPEGSLKVADFYDQVGKRLGIPGKVVQDKQIFAANTLEGKGLPALSDITVAYNALSDEQKTLVGKFSTHAKVARAKFLAFMQTAEGEEEGTITWNEMLTVHPDVAEFLQTEVYGKTLTTPQLGKFEARKGDWKELPGAFRVGYAVYDGKEWKYSQSKGKSKEEYFGNVTEYKDKDGFFYNFEGTKNSLNPLIGPEEPINTAKEGGPRVGDWYQTTIKPVKNQYVVWNGKEWVASGVKGRFPQEFDGDKPLSQIAKEKQENKRR